MKGNQGQHLARLIEALPEASTEARGPAASFLNIFRRRPYERDPVCRLPARRVALKILLWVALLWLIIHFGWVAGVLPRPALQRVFDLRLQGRLDEHDASGMLVPDASHIVISTRGGGVHSIRSDALHFGFARNYDPRTTGGLIPDPDIVEARMAVGRMFFVGESGSLTAASPDLRELRLLFGGVGWKPSLSFGTELSALVRSPSALAFAAGTLSHGAGIYDTTTRQWFDLPCQEGDARWASVRTMAWEGDRLWVGTDAGLRVFRITFSPAGIRAASETWALPPGAIRHLAVRHVQATAGEISCAAGRGALLRREANGRWTELVGEGDARLKGLESQADFGGAVPHLGGYLLLLQHYGPLHYDSEKRLLRLVDKGLPDAAGARGPMLLTATGGVPVLMFRDGGGPFRLNGDKWDKLISDEGGASGTHLVFSGASPWVRLASGNLRPLGVKEADQLFEAATMEARPAAADAGEGMLIVSSGSKLHRYAAARRGWTAWTTGTDAAVQQVRIGPAGIGIVKAGGEAGTVNTSGVYTPVLGSSTLDRAAVPVEAAAPLGKDTFFLHGGKVFVYRRDRAAIENSAGMPAGALPRRIRSTDETIYLWARSDGQNTLFASTGSAWKAYSPPHMPAAHLEQVAVGRQALAARTPWGEVLVDPDKGGTSVFLYGAGQARWRKLVNDNYGRLFGLTEEGSVLYYTPANGAWTPVGDAQGTTDLELDVSADRLYLAGSGGVRVYKLSKEGIESSAPVLFAGRPVLDVALGGGEVWALSGNGQSVSRQVLATDLKGEKVRTAWAYEPALLPGVSAVREAAWAGFAGNNVAFISGDGGAWVYGLNSSRWWNVHGGARASSWRVDERGVLWTLDAGGSLSGLPLAGGDQIDIARTDLKTGRARAASELLQTGATGLLYLAFGLLALAILAMAFRGRPVNLAIIAVVALSLAGVFWLIDAKFVLPSVARNAVFETADFRGKVLDFAVPDGQLAVRTPAGCWWFSRFGIDLRPLRMDAGCLSLPGAGVQEYPVQSPAGDWQIRREAGGFSVYRKMADLGWTEARLGPAGFQHDAVRAIEMAGKRLVALTDAGLVDFAGSAQLSSAGLFRAAGGGRLTRNGDAALYLASTGALQFEGSGKWRPGQPPAGAGPNGIRWTVQPAADVLDPKQFDAQRGRFYADISVSLVQDAQGRLWVETRGGWRRVETADSKVSLPLVNESPTPAPDDRTWEMNTNWRVRSVATGQTDRVTFTFSPTGAATADPFGARGRLADETALSVLSTGGAVLFGTEGGLRQAGSGTLGLAGRRVLAVTREANRIWCRTPEGDFVEKGQDWERAAAPAGLFGPVRQLVLDLGPGLRLQAVERTDGSNAATELSAWDATGRRFLFDQVTDLEGDTAGLWLTTPAGVERLDIDTKGAIRAQSRPLAAVGVSSLRRDAGGLLVAGGTNGTWRLEGSQWKAVPAGAPGNPFSSPLTGRLSPVVNWERHYSSAGDQWRLVVDGRRVAIVDGKLATDEVLATAEGDPRTSVTRVGILRSREVIPLPAGEARVGLRGERLVARTEAGVVEYRDGAWREGDASALPAVAVRFDGMRWSLAEEPALRPRVLVWTAGGRGWTPPTLDARGRFAFDAVESVAALGNSVMIAHEDGVVKWNDALEPVGWTPFSSGTGARARLQADDKNCIWWFRDASNGGRAFCEGDPTFRERTADDLKLAAALAAPGWSSGTTRAGLIKPNVLRLERGGEFPVDLAVNGTAVAMAEQNGQLMIAASRAVYRLDSLMLPHRYKPAPKKNAGKVLLSVYFAFGAWEPAEDQIEKIKWASQALQTTHARAAIRLEGHVDPFGNQAVNEGLALARAQSVERLLTRMGVPRERMKSIGIPEQPTMVTVYEELRRSDIIVETDEGRVAGPAAAQQAKPTTAPPRQSTNSAGMKFVRIDPGSFKMGSNSGDADEKPVHEVTLSKGFYLQTTEVTQAQWQAVMGGNPSVFRGPDLPVENVSWNDVQEFLRKLNAREKDAGYRLPTEAEWEYACRAGGREPDVAPNLGEVAWWGENSGSKTHPVGQKKPNAWGLYDMRGNVYEWVQDWYGPYSAERQVDPQGPPSGHYRVLRGGSWYRDRDYSRRFRCASRSAIMPDHRINYGGFRCARTVL